MERKWLRFLLVHGAEYGFDKKRARADGRARENVHDIEYCFCTRDLVSAIGREGMGDGYELQIRYMLAKFVFIELKYWYKGWVTGLTQS